MSIIKIFLLVGIIIVSISTNAQQIIKLWNQEPPTSSVIIEKEKIEGNNDWITNITSAELHIYQADKAKANGMAVIICPGGGYGGLAFRHEGIELAQWLNTLGITGIVLKYRMPNGHKEIPLDDMLQAMRYAREHAAELGVNSNKIGVAGFSAGGHLAASISTLYTVNEKINTRPDFSILFYPVITMQVLTHGGSRTNLMGDNPSEEDKYIYSTEKQVNRNTPPALLLLSDDDNSVQFGNSLAYYQALKQNKIPSAMYIFPNGGHGWGMNTNFEYHSIMLSLVQKWLHDVETNKIK